MQGRKRSKREDPAISSVETLSTKVSLQISMVRGAGSFRRAGPARLGSPRAGAQASGSTDQGRPDRRGPAPLASCLPMHSAPCEESPGQTPFPRRRQRRPPPSSVEPETPAPPSTDLLRAASVAFGFGPAPTSQPACPGPALRVRRGSSSAPPYPRQELLGSRQAPLGLRPK